MTHCKHRLVLCQALQLLGKLLYLSLVLHYHLVMAKTFHVHLFVFWGLLFKSWLLHWWIVFKTFLTLIFLLLLFAFILKWTFEFLRRWLLHWLFSPHPCLLFLHIFVGGSKRTKMVSTWTFVHFHRASFHNFNVLVSHCTLFVKILSFLIRWYFLLLFLRDWKSHRGGRPWEEATLEVIIYFECGLLSPFEGIEFLLELQKFVLQSLVRVFLDGLRLWTRVIVLLLLHLILLFAL